MGVESTGGTLTGAFDLLARTPLHLGRLFFWLFAFLAGDIYAQVLEYHTQISAEPGELITEESILIQVPDKSLDWLSDVCIRYHNDDEISVLEASLLDGRGKVVRSISKREIVSRHAISEGIFFSDEWIKQFKVVGPAYPYQIRYRFRTVRKKFTRIVLWYPLLYSNTSTQKATLRLTTPLDYTVLIDQPTGQSYDSAIQSNKISRSWAFERIEPVSEQSYAPPVAEQLPHVLVAPLQFDYIVQGNYSTWKEYGKWEAALVEGTEDIPQEEKFVIARLLEGAADPKEKIRRLYHYLQDNTRYVAVEVDEGGQKPLPASFVSTKKYGDCKALVVYLRALLHSAGIPSHYAPIYSGANPVRGARKVPAHRFNHVILCIPAEGDTVWAEATAGYLPFRYLGTSTQAREVLVVDKTSSKLIKTPALQAADVHNHDRYYFTLDGEGGGAVKIIRTYRGLEFEWFRYFQHHRMSQKISDYAREQLTLQDFQIANHEFLASHRDSSFLRHSLNVTLVNQFRKLGGTSAVLPPRFFIPKLDAPAQRMAPVRFTYPLYKTSEISYTLKIESDQIIELPENTTQTSPFGTYTVAYSREASTVSVKKSLLLYAGDYSLDQYSALYSFLEKVTKAEKQLILINRISR